MSGIYPSSPSHGSSASASPSSSSSGHDVRSFPSGRRSVHTAAAMDAVAAGRRSLRTPATRNSVHYPDSLDPQVYPPPRPLSGRPVSARPRTAASVAALAGVVPTGGDRLKHLQLHMEQLQQMYAQEIHKEELSRREAFVQSMCTASITLWRYVCSKPRFFTAVKALVTQYLPASDARLYEVEETEGAEGLTLVLADGRAVAVHSQTETIGVAGRAVLATSQLSATEWNNIQKKAAIQSGLDDDGVQHDDMSAASLSKSSSLSSSTAADEITRSKPGWLDRHADCVLPSANDHLFVLLPLDRVYRDSGFDPEIDLTIKKRDLFEGSTTKQLLVVVLRDATKRPLGVFEALLTTRKPIQIDFLDAFASLLAAALEARRSICRPMTGAGISVDIVHEQEVPGATSPDASRGPNQSGQLVLEIAPGIKMVVAGSASAQSAENDLPLLEAVRKPMAELFSHKQRWERRATFLETRGTVEMRFWSTIVALILRTESGENEDNESSHQAFRSDVRNAVDQLSDVAVRFTILFEAETVEQFDASKTSRALDPPSLSVEGQFAALEQAIQTGETFSSTPFVTALPITVGELNAAVLVLVESVDAEDQDCVDYLKSHTLPLALKAVELALWIEHGTNERAATRVEVGLLTEALQEAEIRASESEAVLDLSQRLALCESMEEIVQQVHQFVAPEEMETRPANITLYLADYMDEENDQQAIEVSQVHSIWTVRAGVDRVMVYERDNVTSPRRGAQESTLRRGGMAAFILESGAPLMYTQHHPSFDPGLRERIRGSESTASEITGGHFYAAPLCVHATSRVHGVLEFAFATEGEQKAFAASRFAISVGSTVERFLELHHWITTRHQQQVREAADTKTKNDDVWSRWRTFVAALCDLTEIDMNSWKLAAVCELHKLISRASHLNILIRGEAYGVDGAGTGDDDLIDTISRELHASEQHVSPSLNVHNHTLLECVAAFPLGELGLLVIASESNVNGLEDRTEFSEEVERFGAPASRLLSYQLHHITTARQRIEEVRALLESITHVEQRLLNEQDARAMLARTVTQQSVLLRVYQLIDTVVGVQSEDEVMAKIVHSITDSMGGESADVLCLSVLVSGDDEDGWFAWISGSNAKQRLCTSVSRFLSSCGTTTSYDAPLASAQLDFVHQLWPQEQVTAASRLAITPLEETSHGRSQTGRLVLLVPEVDHCEAFVDSLFAADLSRALGRVVACFDQKRHHRETQAQLDQVTTALERTQSELQASRQSGDRWVKIRQRVFGRLQMMGDTDVVVEATEASAVREELLSAVQNHLQQEVGAVLCDDASESTVRIVTRRGADDALVSETISEWIRPTDLQQFLARTRRRGSSDDTVCVEFFGGVGENALAARWKVKCDASNSTALSAVVAVRLSDQLGNFIEPNRIVAFMEEALMQASELSATVENVLALCGRVREGTRETARLAQLLEESTLENARKAQDKIRRLRIDHTMTRLLNNVGNPSSMIATIHELPGFCLWIHEHDEAALWTVQHDGVKRIRAYAPPTWETSECAVEIHVEGQCEFLLEVVGGEDFDINELKLVAAVLEGAIKRRRLQQKLDELQAQTSREACERARNRELEDAHRCEIVRHWHGVDKLLHSSTFATGMSEGGEAWTQTIEKTVLEALPDVAAIRFVFMDLDVVRRRVVASDTENAFDARDHLAALLDLWVMEEGAASRTKVLAVREDAMMVAVPHLFTGSPEDASTAILIGLPMEGTLLSKESLQSFATIVALTRLPLDAVPVDIIRALEIDLRLVANAYTRYREHDATRRRAIESEMALVAVKEHHEESQQWISFMQNTQHEAERLVRTTVEAAQDFACGNVWGVIAELVEAFIQAACGCDGVDLYDVVVDGVDSNRLLVPLTTCGAALSPTARSCEFAKSLDRLVNEAPTREPSTFETTSSGSRLVSAVHDVRHARVVGVVVIYWNETTRESDPMMEIVNTLVRPWLAIVFSMVHDAESQRIARDASTIQNKSLAEEKNVLETQGLEMKSHLLQADQRNASLQATLQAASELMELLQKRVSSVASTEAPAALWITLVDEISSVKGVHGVQLYEATGEHEPIMSKSTLSNAEDASVLKALHFREGGDIVRLCIQSQQPHELRVLCQSEYKRVRVIGLQGREQGGKCLVIVFTSDKHVSHQQLAFVDQYVALCVALTAHRVVELEKMEVQTAAASALETAAQDLTARLRESGDALHQAQESLSWRKALESSLARDLLAQDVWRPLEKTAQASFATTSTAKLTAMWRFLQENTQRRLLAGLAGKASVSVQLYGVVKGKRGFVFSLPSQQTALDRPVAKGFFCVALGQLEQRREWRKMVQCISTDSQVPAGDSLVEGTTVFPVRRYYAVPPKTKSDLVLDENDSDDDDEGESTREVVGVLLVKIRNLADTASGITGTSIVQDVADAIAPRVEWIGSVVEKKQRSGNQPKPTQPLASTAELHLGGIAPELSVVMSDLEVGQVGSQVSQTKVESDIPRKSNAMVDSVSRTSLVEPLQNPVHPALTYGIDQTSSAPGDNQGDHGRPASRDEDPDSDDEREAERIRDRMRAAVAAGVLDFVLRVQSLPVDEDSDCDAALRLLVAREMKNVWSTHGDERKHLLGACELFFYESGILRDTSDSAKATTTSSAPQWVFDLVSRAWVYTAKQPDGGFRLWKIDSSRWLVSQGITSASGSVVLLVALTGSTSLSSVFDAMDEQRHLPALMRAVASHMTHILRVQSRQTIQRQQKSSAENAAAQRDAHWQGQCDELHRRSKLEEQLSAATMTMLLAMDERAVIQTALQTMQLVLGCDQVAFHAATSSLGEAKLDQPREERGDISGVAMETVIRVRVMPLSAEVDERELLGTMVARFTENERVRMDASLSVDAKAWTMGLLQRLADATAIATTALRQRLMLRQAEMTLASASEGLETQGSQLLTLQDENDVLQQQVEALTAVNRQNRDLDRDNAALREQLEQLRAELAASGEARAAMAGQLKQYETQLVEVNCQLEQSIRAETQLMRLEEDHTASLAREARLEKKALKHKLQLKQLVAELTARRDKDARDQAELSELRRHVAVLTEKQRHSGGMDASSVASAVMQAQAQAMAQTQAIQQHHSQAELQQRAQQQRVHTALQRRMFRQLQLQQHAQKRKQLDLAQELRQLAALEVEEMTRRASSVQHVPQASPRKKTLNGVEVAKVHEVRSQVSTGERVAEETATRPVSRLRVPRIAVSDQNRQER